MDFRSVVHIIITNWKTLVKFSALVIVLVFLVLMLVYPLTYQSSVTVLPPEKNSSMGGLSSILGGGDIANLISGGSLNANSQLFMEILKSRSAAEYVVTKNKLMDFYGADDMDEAVKKLQKSISMELSKEGIIRFSTEVSTPLFPMFNKGAGYCKNLAAEISNSYIEALDKINRDKLSSKARNARMYIESELVKTRYTLDSVEYSLMHFQKTNKTISLPEQVKTSIETAAKLKSEIVKSEVELGIAQTNLREDNKDLIRLREQLQQLKNQYDKIEVGSPDYLMTFKEVPELGKAMASLMREVKIQNEVYLLLQQQYYKEKIQENRDLPTVEILDKAIPPKKASGPRTVYSSVLSGVFAFLIMSVVMLYSENKRKKI